MSSLISRFVIALAIVVLAACSGSPDAIRKTLLAHPEILTEVIEKHPAKFMEALQKAQYEARRVGQEKQQQEAQRQMMEEVKAPKKPEIAADRAIRGNAKAPIQLVVYSDFECPYCKKGWDTVEEFRKKYGDKVVMIYKHLPLEFHPLAMPAAKRYEAIALQSSEKAYKFHDEVFKSQEKMHPAGEKFLDEAAKRSGADMARMKKDMEGDKVKARIAADMEEARKFGFRGTPGFLLNGVSIKGALPVASFEEILQKRPTYN